MLRRCLKTDGNEVNTKTLLVLGIKTKIGMLYHIPRTGLHDKCMINYFVTV